VSVSLIFDEALVSLMKLFSSKLFLKKQDLMTSIFYRTYLLVKVAQFLDANALVVVPRDVSVGQSSVHQSMALQRPNREGKKGECWGMR